MWFAVWVPPSRSEKVHSLMRIVVHDFSGHPGQIQLSRELARRGHSVEHQFCTSYTTGRGATEIREGDSASLSIRGIALGGDFARYSPLRRIFQEFKYGWLSIRATLAARPDVAIFSNLPMIPLAIVSTVARLRRIPYILWWQDVYSSAIDTIARQRFGERLGGLVGWLAQRIERRCAQCAAAVIPITSAFVDRLDEWGIDRSKVTVIPNWGALDEIETRPRLNAWSNAHNLDDVRVIMYTGTLGLKHDPAIILELARNAPADCRVVVVSQGKGRQWLEDHGSGEPGLILLDFQPYDQLPDMLGSADVLFAALERGASKYSVPSKVLNYLCAGRPVLASLPAENAVAHTINSAGAGIVVPSQDEDAASEALHQLLQDAGLRKEMSSNARRYAEREFDIGTIVDRFESAIQDAASITSPRRGTRVVKG